MCTLATHSSYRGGQGFQVRRVLQAKVSDNLASRGISTNGLWDVKPSHKLSADEQRRLERQRANKRNWARKEREKSKKRLEELKMTNCQLEYHNKKLRSEIDKLRRGHFELKTLLKDHDCRKLNHVTTFVPTPGVLLASSHPPSEVGLGQKFIETAGPQVVIVCSSTSDEKGNDQGTVSSASRRRAKSESSAVFMANEGSVQKHYQKRVSWPADSVTYFLVEDDFYFETPMIPEDVALETSAQLTGDEDIADDESVASGGFATSVGNGEVGESVEVGGGSFLRMLIENGVVEVSANEDVSDSSRSVFIHELNNSFSPKIAAMDSVVKNGLNGSDTLVIKGAGNAGSGVEMDADSTSQQLPSSSKQVARALSYPLTDTKGLENRSNCENMLSRRQAMDPWCVSEDLNGLRRVQKQLSEGSESGTCHSSVSLGINVVPPGFHCPKETDKHLPKAASWRHDASEASAAKRPRFSSLPEDATLPELVTVQEGAAVESDRNDQTIMDHVYHVSVKDRNRSATNEMPDSEDEIDTNFRPVGRLIPVRTTPSTPSTPSSTDSTVPSFPSSASPTLATSFSEATVDTNG